MSLQENRDSGDLWLTDEFEGQVASTLVSMWEKRLDPRASRNKDAAMRLTEVDLINARMFGPYIPGKRREFFPVHLRGGARMRGGIIFPKILDATGGEMPLEACCSQSDSEGLYCELLHIRKVGHEKYKASYFYGNAGATKGFSPTVSILEDGTVGLIDSEHWKWEEDQSTYSFLNFLYHVIKVDADRRFCWQIEAKEKIARVFLGCEEEQVKSLLYASSLPMSETGRKRPALHLVESHKRRMNNGTDIDISGFLGGKREVEMGGTLFRVHAPAAQRLEEN